MNRSVASGTGAGILVAVLAGCSSPVVKQEAFDPDVLVTSPLPADLLEEAADGERIVKPWLDWMAVDTRANLVFASYRHPDGGDLPCLVLSCSPDMDQLVLLPLDENESPLDALADSDRVESLRLAISQHAGVGPSTTPGSITLSLAEVVESNQLGPPLPPPGRMLAVAANYPTHLQYDLDIDPEYFEAISRSRPRIFQKHPPFPVPNTRIGTSIHEHEYRGVIGPFDGWRYPEQILLPRNEEGESEMVDTVLDYEVEIGVVIGQMLDEERVRDATDEELFAAVAGYVLVSDVKSRNPQLYNGIRARGTEANGASPYATGEPAVDNLLGEWDLQTCSWWSYAASQGDYASIGPFFVATPGAASMPPRAMICARSYGDPDVRGKDTPPGRKPGAFYLRQCSITTSEPGHRDALIWSVPTILRSLFEEKNVLRLGNPRRLEPGDIISLGTPGGVVLTVRDRGFYRFLDNVLFWWDALDWHNAFFAKDEELYLRGGDEVFLWAEGLGFQRQRVEAIGEAREEE